MAIEPMTTSVPPSVTDIFMPDFRMAAGLGSELEIRLRLLADLIVSGGKLGVEKDLSEVVQQIQTHFSRILSDIESEFLVEAVRLRNKVLHADFQAALKKVSDLRPGSLRTHKVHMLDLTNGNAQSVADATKKEAGVFGWFIEAANNGSFNQAASVFEEAVVLVKKLAWEQSRPR